MPTSAKVELSLRNDILTAYIRELIEKVEQQLENIRKIIRTLETLSIMVKGQLIQTKEILKVVNKLVNNG